MKRTRAYRPEVPGRLEDRALLSSAAPSAADPRVLLSYKLTQIGQQTQTAFQLYLRDGECAHLGDSIHGVVVMIPFQQADGLSRRIAGILSNMRHDIRAHVPDAVQTAYRDVIDVILLDVEAGVHAGKIVIR